MSVTALTIEATLAGLRDEACSMRDVPFEVAHAAATAASRTFAHFRERPLTTTERRRVTAYFEAVVRRRVIRGRDGRLAASRAVLRAVVADLRSAGCGAQRIAEELERGWRGRVPDDVLEEVTLRLVS